MSKKWNEYDIALLIEAMEMSKYGVDIFNVVKVRNQITERIKNTAKKHNDYIVDKDIWKEKAIINEVMRNDLLNSKEFQPEQAVCNNYRHNLMEFLKLIETAKVGVTYPKHYIEEEKLFKDWVLRNYEDEKYTRKRLIDIKTLE